VESTILIANQVIPAEIEQQEKEENIEKIVI
jgi:hypothetical protein